MTGTDRPAPCLLKIEDVASRLHKSTRWMQDFLRENPFGRMAGRTRLFTEADIAAIIEALPCPSNSSNATVPPSGISAVPSEASMWTRAQKLLTASRRKPSEIVNRQLGGGRAVIPRKWGPAFGPAEPKFVMADCVVLDNSTMEEDAAS